MPSVKGITCSVTIASRPHPAEECGLTADTDFASSYVVAEANRNFCVNVSSTGFIHPIIEIYVYIDGKYHNSSIWDELTPEKSIDEKYHGKRERDGDDRVAFERAWRFDDLVVVDEKDESCEQEESVLSNIGTIEVVVIRCNEIPRKRKGRRRVAVPGHWSRHDPTAEPHPQSKPYWVNWSEERDPDAEDAKPKSVFERDIKSLDATHRIATEEEEVVASYVWNAKMAYLDSFEKPYCILVMKYRSRSTLQSMGYIPRSPVSSREPSPVDLEELRALSQEEMLKRLLRYKKIAESTKRIKSSDGGEGGSKRVKKESPWGSGVVVDLTED